MNDKARNCAVQGCPTRMGHSNPHSLCYKHRPAKLGPSALDQFDTAEKIDAEVARLTNLRASHLSAIAALEERKAQLPVLVDPQDLAALRRKANEHDVLNRLLDAVHAPAFQYDLECSYVERLTRLIAKHPNMLCGRRM